MSNVPAPLQFRSATREIVWRLERGAVRWETERLEQGMARRFRENGGWRIEAGTGVERLVPGVVPDDLAFPPAESMSGLTEDLAAIAGSFSGHLRLVQQHRVVYFDEKPRVQSSSLLICSLRDEDRVLRITTSPSHALGDTATLCNLFSRPLTSQGNIERGLPMVWVGGTASVLLHEVVGHPSELGLALCELPRWIRVVDDPSCGGIGDLDFDDAGELPLARILSAGEAPSALRCERFRDVPLRRLSNLVVTSDVEPAPLPLPRLEIHLVDEGNYDPLTGLASLTVAIAIVRNSDGVERRLPPFVISTSRLSAGAKLAGACLGPLERYQGVICSTEGQQVPVGSYSIPLATIPLEFWRSG